MLYVVIEAERARLKKLHKENELITPKSRLIPEDKGGTFLDYDMEDGPYPCPRIRTCGLLLIAVSIPFVST